MTDTPSRQTLDQVPGRTVTFTLGVAKYSAIAALLGTKGYGQEEHDFVWERLKKLGDLPSAGSTAGTPNKAVRDAISELDQWDEPNFAVIRAALHRHFPALVDVVFMDLEPKVGEEAVLSVSTLLDRLDELEAKTTDPDAQGAIKMLAKRSYTKTERQRLRDLVTTATKYTMQPLLTDEQRVETLMELYNWITDWSTTARAVIKRRQHLIALGIAAPRKSHKDGDHGQDGQDDDKPPVALPAQPGNGAAAPTNGSAAPGGGSATPGP